MENAPEQHDITPLAPVPERTESVPIIRLEDRIQRLEDAVAFLTHHVSWDEREEELRSQKPVARITLSEGIPSSHSDEGESELSAFTSDLTTIHHGSNDRAKPEPIPRATPIPAPTASLAEFSLPRFAEPPLDRPSKLSTMLKPIQNALPVASTVVNKVLPPSSLFRDLWWDIRITWRMLRDSTYPMTTACKVFPLFALFYVTIWPYLSAWSGILGTVMNYFVNAIVIYIAFKIVQRELRRYYEFTQRYQR